MNTYWNFFSESEFFMVQEMDLLISHVYIY